MKNCFICLLFTHVYYLGVFFFSAALLPYFCLWNVEWEYYIRCTARVENSNSCLLRHMLVFVLVLVLHHLLLSFPPLSFFFWDRKKCNESVLFRYHLSFSFAFWPNLHRTLWVCIALLVSLVLWELTEWLIAASMWLHCALFICSHCVFHKNMVECLSPPEDKGFRQCLQLFIPITLMTS